MPPKVNTHKLVGVRSRVVVSRVVVSAVIALIAYGAAVSGVLPPIVATKPAFTCPNAPARNASITTRAEDEQVGFRLDGAARQLWRAGKDWKQGKRPNQLVALRARLAERKNALVQTMRVDANAAVAALLTRDERAEYGAVAGNCLESEVTLEGNLQVLQSETFAAEGSRQEYTLTTDRRQVFTVYPANADQAELISGSRIRVRGYRIGNEVLFNATASLTPAAELDTGGFTTLTLPAAALTTQYRVAVLRTYFSDEAEPATPTPQSMADLMATVDAYYQENSYGAAGFASDVYGWYQVPMTKAQCQIGNLMTAAIAAADPDVNFTQFTNVMVIYHATPNCSNAGSGGLSPSRFTTADGMVYMGATWITRVVDWVVAHELGHNLGNHHASFLPCDPPVGNTTDPACKGVEYGDPYSVMGNLGLGHFAAKHKDLSGFFAPGMLQAVTTGPSDFVLEPIETATGGLKAVKVLRGYQTIGGYDDYLYVEYRRPLGADAALTSVGFPDFFNGAELRVSGLTRLHSGLFDSVPQPANARAATLPVGSTYTDPQSGVKVQTLGQTDDALAVRVTPGRSEWTPPTVQIASPVSNGTYSGTLPVSATATDASGIARVEFRVGNLYPNVAPFATVTSAPFTANLDTTQLPNGRSWITVTAYDNAGAVYGTTGNMSTVQTAFYVDNAEASPLSVTLTAPTEGASFTGPTVLTATPSFPSGVWKVEFYVDGSTTPTIDYSAPYTTTTSLVAGGHTALAAAYNFTETRYDSASVSFTVLPDGAPPPATLTAPVDGASTGGTIPIDFSWSGNPASITDAQLFVDGSYAQISRTAPFTPWWDTRGFSDGAHTLQVTVTYRNSSGGYSQVLTQTVTATVDNSAPTVGVTEPASGASVSGATTIAATAAHAAGISRVDFYYDGVRLIGTDTTALYSVSWDPAALTAGAHTLTARAVNAYGIAATSAAVSVTLVDATAPAAVNNLSAGSP